MGKGCGCSLTARPKVLARDSLALVSNPSSGRVRAQCGNGVAFAVANCGRVATFIFLSCLECKYVGTVLTEEGSRSIGIWQATGRDGQPNAVEERR